MIRGINHITLSIADLDRSLAFYCDVLGCGVVARWPEGCYLQAGNLWLALVVEENVRSAPLPEYTHLAFDVAPDDFQAMVDRVKQSGASVFQDNSTEGASLYFLDPDGHKLELHVGSLATRLDEMRRNPWDGLQVMV